MSHDHPELRRADGAPLRILAVDDEPMLTDLLAMALRMEGWEVRTAASGLEALQVARDFEPDALILDVMMPDLDGMSVLRRLRESGNLVPVLFLTAKDAVEDRIAGLTAGGDDYVTKPFSLEEIIARLRAVIRRAGSARTDDEQAILRVADLSLNEDSHEVFRGDDEIELTATEFELLRYLMRNERRVLSKAQILDRVWSYDFGGKSSVVELYISYLRKKIDVGRTPLLHTVRGVGYMIKAPQ
ncbi:MAG: response regulator transcription factor [Microbacterium sp.]